MFTENDGRCIPALTPLASPLQSVRNSASSRFRYFDGTKIIYKRYEITGYIGVNPPEKAHDLARNGLTALDWAEVLRVHMIG